jgi:hypothetical protein
MHPSRIGQKFLCHTAKSRPCHLVFLAASAQLLAPRTANFITETCQPFQIVRYRMIVEVAAHDPLQPCADLTYGLVSFPFQLLPDVRERRSQSLLYRQSQYLEVPSSSLRAAMRESEKVEGFRPSQSSLLAPMLCVATEFDQSRFLRVKRQSEFGETFFHGFQKVPRLFFVLKSEHTVVSITNHDALNCIVYVAHPVIPSLCTMYGKMH